LRHPGAIDPDVSHFRAFGSLRSAANSCGNRVRSITELLQS
jgi:hypothetical protein